MAVPGAELVANPQVCEPGYLTARGRGITSGIRCM